MTPKGCATTPSRPNRSWPCGRHSVQLAYRPRAWALQPFLAGNARFVVSLAKQYSHPTVSSKTVVTAAHGAVIDLLNRSAHRVDRIEKLFVLTLRNAMADGPR